MEIYCLTNVISRKKYVGKTEKTIAARYGKRWWNVVSNRLVKEDLNTLSPNCFLFSVLEKTDRKEDLCSLEKKWIKELNTLYPNGYNLQPGGEGSNHIEETKKRIKETMLSSEFKQKNKRLFLKQKETSCEFCGASVISYKARGKYKKFCNNTCRHKKSLESLLNSGRGFNDKKVNAVLLLLDKEQSNGR